MFIRAWQGKRLKMCGKGTFVFHIGEIHVVALCFSPFISIWCLTNMTILGGMLLSTKAEWKGGTSFLGMNWNIRLNLLQAGWLLVLWCGGPGGYWLSFGVESMAGPGPFWSGGIGMGRERHGWEMRMRAQFPMPQTPDSNSTDVSHRDNWCQP